MLAWATVPSSAIRTGARKRAAAPSASADLGGASGTVSGALIAEGILRESVADEAGGGDEGPAVGGVGAGAGTVAGGVEAELLPERLIEEVARTDVLESGEHDGFGAGVFRLQIVDHRADDLALQVVLRAAQIAREDGER